MNLTTASGDGLSGFPSRILNFLSFLTLEDDAVWRRVLGLLIAIFLFNVYLTPLNHDVAWHLFAAKRLLEGGRLYVDLVEYNPPLIYYLKVPIVWLAGSVGLAPFVLFDLVLVGTLLGLVWLANRNLAAGFAEMELGFQRWFSLILLFVLLLTVDRHWGQREHLILAFLLPYVTLAASRAEGCLPASRLRELSTGVLLALAFAIKPHYGLVWAAVEVYVWLVKKSAPPWTRLENWVMGVGLLGYLILVLVLFPEYLDTVRLAAATYSNYDLSFWATFFYSVEFSLSAICLYWIFRSEVGPHPLPGVLAVSLCASFLVAFSFLKGWQYHYYPASSLAICLLFCTLSLLASKLEGGFRKPFQVVTLLLVSILVAFKTTDSIYENSRLARDFPYSDLGQISRLLREEAYNLPVIFLSPSMDPAFPAVNLSGAIWGLRFPFLWTTVSLYPDGFERRTPAEMSPIERQTIAMVVEDMIDKQPVLVITDDRVTKQGLGNRPFDYVEYFTQDSHFAEEWKKYRFKQIIGTYRIFERMSGPQESSGGTIP